MSLVSTWVISPTRPRAGSFTVAVMRPPSLPDTPTADTFCRANSWTMDLFTWADRASSAVSSTAWSV